MSEYICEDYKDIVSKIRVYDLDESLTAAGYPMRAVIPTGSTITEKDINRATRLVEATKTGNNAHVQFLTGIRVNFDLTFTNKAWVEAERYRFLEFVSSQSTMHRITQFDVNEQCNSYVDKRVIAAVQDLIDRYNRIDPQDEVEATLKKELYYQILYSNPAGFRLTARMTTNYRCLRNIYIQRKDHSLKEWREFCKWIESLPYSELITGKVDTTEKI